MIRTNSPPYPAMSLPKSIAAVEKIFGADRRNPVDREVAARHIGYNGKSGASDKALAALSHFGLTEKVGKGALRVSQLAMDILHPDPADPQSKDRALLQAGMKPQLYKELRAQFPDYVSEATLRSYLLRTGFNDAALPPAMAAYLDTLRFLEQSKVFESGGVSSDEGEESDLQHEPQERQMQPEPAQHTYVGRTLPNATPAETPPPAGVRRAVFDLTEGEVVITFPEDLSPESVSDLQDYINVFMKKARREAGVQ